MRAAFAIAVLLSGCGTSSKPCTTCDCNRGVFRLGELLPRQSAGSWDQGDVTLTMATLSYGDTADGRSESILGPTEDGGTFVVTANHGVGLNPKLPVQPVAVTWYAEDDFNYQSSGGAYSFGNRGVQLIFHQGGPSAREGPVLAPVSAYVADFDAGTVSVTFEDQTITGLLHQQVPFTRRGADWCLGVDEMSNGFKPLSTWALYQLDALAEL